MIGVTDKDIFTKLDHGARCQRQQCCRRQLHVAQGRRSYRWALVWMDSFQRSAERTGCRVSVERSGQQVIVMVIPLQ